MADNNGMIDPISTIKHRGRSVESLEKTIDFLNTRNRDIILQENKLKEFVAKLDLHDSDKQYVYDRLNEAELAKSQYMNNSTNSWLANNPGYGLNDYLKAAGDIYGNKVIYDMVANNKLYETYMQKNVYDNNNISEEAREYYKKNITYNSDFITDKNSKQIGVRQWTPNMQVYDTPNFYKIVDSAAKFIAEKISNGKPEIIFRDENGEVLPSSVGAAGASFYDKVTKTTTYKSMEDIKKAAMDIIAGDELLQNSLKRQFDIESFAAGSNGGVPGQTTGLNMSYDQWLDSKLTPLADDAKYYNTNEDVSAFNTLKTNPYGTGSLSSISSGKGGKGITGLEALAESSVPAGFSIYKINEGALPYNRFNSYNTELEQIFKENGLVFKNNPNGKIKLTNTTAIKRLQNNGKYDRVMELIHQRNNAWDDYNNYKSKISNTDDRDLIDSYTRISSGAVMPYRADNKYDKPFVDMLNDIAGDGDTIEYYVPRYMRDYFEEYLISNNYKMPDGSKTDTGYNLTREQFMSLGVIMNLAAQHAMNEANVGFLGLPTLDRITAGFNDNEQVRIYRYKNGKEEGEVKTKTGAPGFLFGSVDTYEITKTLYENLMNKGKELVDKYNIKGSYTVPNQTLEYYDLYHKHLADAANSTNNLVQRASFVNAAESYGKNIKDKINESIIHFKAGDGNIALYNPETREYTDLSNDDYIKYAKLISDCAAQGLLTNIKRTAVPYYNNKTNKNESQYNVVINVPTGNKVKDTPLADYAGQTISVNLTGVFPYDKDGYDHYYNRRIDTWSSEAQALNFTPDATRAISHHNVSSSYGSYIKSLDGKDRFEISLMGNRFIGDNYQASIAGAITDAISDYKINKNKYTDAQLLQLQANTFEELAYYIMNGLNGNPKFKNILKSIDAEVPELKLGESINNSNNNQ